jgi:hypothetical protein
MGLNEHMKIVTSMSKKESKSFVFNSILIYEILKNKRKKVFVNIIEAETAMF